MKIDLTETNRRYLRSMLFENWAKLERLGQHRGSAGDLVAGLIEKLDDDPAAPEDVDHQQVCSRVREPVEDRSRPASDEVEKQEPPRSQGESDD